MSDAATDADWIERSARAALASHRLIGWIFWDPRAVANYEALGVPDGLGYYIATRAAPLAAAGNQVVMAAFGSIHPDFVHFALDQCRAHSTFAAAADARDRAVVTGLHEYVPEIVEPLAALADPLWAAADALPAAGRTLFAAHREWPRPTNDPLLSAWLAVNCLREWRGDTHWAIQVAEGLSTDAAGVLDGAWRHYDDHWVARSRGADDGAVDAALEELAARGLADDGRVNDAGLDYRQQLEDQLDRLTAVPWRHLGAALTDRFIEVVEPVGLRLMARVDATAGPNWMPAGRDRGAPTPASAPTATSHQPGYGQVNREYGMRLATTEPADDGPIWMVNLMSYKERAEYADGSGPDVSGREADDLYAPIDVLADIGAEVVFLADVDAQLLGHTPSWHRVGIVKYPTRRSFIEMQTRPDFAAKHVHKEAGMASTIVMGCLPIAPPATGASVDWADVPHPPTSGDGPVAILHVIKYAEGGGREQLVQYQHKALGTAGPHGVRIGGWFEVEDVIVGDGRSWDEVRLNVFPSRAAFMAVAADPARLAAQAEHREPSMVDTYTMILRPLIDRLPGSQPPVT